MTSGKSGTPVLTAIGSGKGGTGKTFVTVSLAQALARLGARVLVCDADLGLSNAGLHLGQTAKGRLADVLSGRAGIADAVTPVSGGAGTPCGFDLLAAPAGSGLLANAGTVAAQRLLSGLRRAGAYDRVLIDLAAGVDDTVMRFAAGADEIMLVMTPDPAALTDAYAFTKLLAGLHGTTPSLLVNMAAGQSDAQRCAGALTTAAKTFLQQSPFYLGFVPRDGKALEAIRRQVPLLTLYPDCPASKAIEQLAAAMQERWAGASAPSKQAQTR